MLLSFKAISWGADATSGKENTPQTIVPLQKQKPTDGQLE